MAGYRVNFDGSLNERRDVAQVTSVSLLTNLVTFPPTIAGTGFNGDAGGFPIRGYINLDNSEPWPNTTNPWQITGTYGNILGPTAITSQTSSGGLLSITDSLGYDNGLFASSSLLINSAALTGTFNVQVRVNHTGLGEFRVYKSPVSGGGIGGVATTTLGSISNTPLGFRTLNFNVALSNEMLTFQTSYFGGSGPFTHDQIDYITITQGGPVTITPATNVNGVAPAGGISAIASPSTIINGQSILAGAPKLFGARVVHDTIDILEAKYLPPADASEDAQADPSAVKFITATSTSISVEGDGLGGAEKLGALETELIVEQTPGTTEN